MDPNATLRMIDEASRVDADTREAVANLQRWLSRGGFSPDWAAYPTGARRFRRALGVKKSSRQHASKKTTKRSPKKTSSRRRSHAHATTARAFTAVTVPPAVLHGSSIGVGDIVKRADRDDKNCYVVTEIRGPWVFTQRISGSGGSGTITFPSALMLKKVG